MAKADVYVKIKYNAKKGEEKVFIEETNIKKDLVEDFLLDWLLTQVGRGKDNRVRVEKDIYSVTIGCDLSDDTFFVQSDTNNDGLTCGIVMSAAGK